MKHLRGRVKPRGNASHSKRQGPSILDQIRDASTLSQARAIYDAGVAAEYASPETRRKWAKVIRHRIRVEHLDEPKIAGVAA